MAGERGPEQKVEPDADPDSTGEATGTAVLVDLHRRARYRRWLGRYVLVVLAVFFGSAFAGYAVVDAIPIEQFQGLIPDESVLPAFTTVSIALNNLRVLAMVATGMVSLGLIALFVLFVNGLVVGAVVALAVRQSSWVVILAALLPHGLIELSAFWIGAAISLRFSHRLVRFALGYDDRPMTRIEAFELVVWFAALALAIVVAAWIEVNVTPAVVRRVAGPDALPIS